jgi:hypothetical protein
MGLKQEHEFDHYRIEPGDSGCNRLWMLKKSLGPQTGNSYLGYDWRKIAIALIEADKSEVKAQACDKAWFRQLIPPRAEIMNETEQEFWIPGLSG